MSSVKKYVRGNSKEVTFDNGGSLINLSFNVNDFLSGDGQQNIADFADDKGWVKITVAPKREVDQYGNTHSLYLNEYRPDPNYQSQAGNPPVASPEGDDAPF